MHIVIMGCGRVGSDSRADLEQQGHTVAVDRPGPHRLPPAGLRLRRPPGHRGRLRPGHPARGGHRGGGRLRRGLQRRQLEHHRRPGGPRDVRHRERRGPHLRPAARRGLPAPGHPDRGHRPLDRRPDAAPAAALRAPSRCGATPAAGSSSPRCTPPPPGSATRSARCRRRPASAWRSSPGWARRCCPPRRRCCRRATWCT